MSLYVRLQTNFWTNRKTIRLQAAIGESAFWVPPRLWSYAASNQPDGDFSKYSAEEIALLIGYPSNAQAMLEALIKVGFMDNDMKIHDWSEHNGYHNTFAERARTAANARWEKKRNREEKKVQDKTRQEISIASSNAQASVSKCKQSVNNCELLLTEPELTDYTPDKSKPELIYAEYPLKVGRGYAIKAITKALSKHPFDFLIERTRKFSEIRNGNKDFMQHPATWFNGEHFLDDEKTWYPKINGRANIPIDHSKGF